MKILAVDTSSKTAYVSLAEAGQSENKVTVRPIAQYSFEAASHTTALIKMIDSILSLSGIGFDDIDMYAASVGPGSFTGVRIGVSAIKGFAFADSKPCVGVSSVSALAFGLCGCRGIITPLIDARRGTYYTGAFLSDACGTGFTRLSDDGQLETEEYLVNLQTLREQYPASRLIMTGDGAEKMAKCALERGINADVVSANAAYGAAVAAYDRFIRGGDGEFTDKNLLPVYLKKSQAEREREERLAAEQKNNY